MTDKVLDVIFFRREWTEGPWHYENPNRALEQLIAEQTEPQGSDKVVCHNCGCGC